MVWNQGFLEFCLAYNSSSKYHKIIISEKKFHSRNYSERYITKSGKQLINRRPKSTLVLAQRFIKKRAGGRNRCNNKYSQSFSLKLYILRSISDIMMPAPSTRPYAQPRRPRHPFQLCHSRKPAGMQPIRPTPWQLLLLCNDGYYTILKGFPFSSRDIQNLVFDTRFSSPASYCSQLCNKKKSIIVKCLLYHYNGSD